MVLYVVVVVCMLVFVRCEGEQVSEEELTQGSILISFGDSRSGGGELKRVEAKPEVASPPVEKPKVAEPPTPTDERNDVEQMQPEESEEQDVAQPREVNKRALFPGSASKGDESHGEDESQRGVAGDERGTSDAANSLLGGGLSGDFDLAGRSLMGSLPVPLYSDQDEGRVVMNITVDESGRVTSASLRANSSTTNNSKLIDAARNAALKARFTPSQEFMQSGTITYIFKLN